MSTSAKYIATFIVGIVVGVAGYFLVDMRVAPTSPIILKGENTGRIVRTNVEGWPTPNFMFQQEGRLPVVLYPALGEAQPSVTLLDGREISYPSFVGELAGNSEQLSRAVFEIEYRENDVDELGYVHAMQQVQ